MAIVVEDNGFAAQINTADPSLSFTTTPAANSLIYCVFCSIRAVTETLPGGYTTGPANSTTTDLEAHTFWKFSDGTETSVQVTGLSAAEDTTIAYIEVSGLDHTASPEDSTEDETYQAGAGAKTCSSDSSTGAVPTSANGIAIASFSIDNGFNFDNGTNSVDNSYTMVDEFGTQFYHCAMLAYKTYTSTAAQKVTLTTTDVGDANYGTMQVFAEAGGGGGVTVPIMHNHYRNLRAA